ncbi:MAG TPA: hypothetical protein VH643_39540 [Gemmataceae bacterium]|jgi:hypothetical protein
MPRNENPNTPRSRPKKFKKKPADARSGRLRLALLVGGGVGGLVVVGLMIWGVVWLFSGGGLSGAVVAKARPAETKPPPDAFLLDQVPAAAAAWKVTPDGLPLTTGLVSAVPLPDGMILDVLFAEPDRATAAVLTTKAPPGRAAARRVDSRPADPGEWLQVDLKGGRVVGQTPVEGVRNSINSSEGMNAALSPSGERLAVAFPRNGMMLEVWDRAGKKILAVKETEPRRFPPRPPGFPTPTRDWVGFVGEDRVLVLAADKLIATEVPSGAVAYTVAGVKAPVALSPGRQWVCAAAVTDELKFFHAADGTPAGEIPKFGWPRAAAFSPDGAALAVTYDAVVVWDVATGKPSWGMPIPRTTANESSVDWVGWFGRYPLARGFLFDPEANLAVCEYDCRRKTVARASGPDGRLWAAGSYQEELKPVPGSSKKLTPGPIADAGAGGTKLLAAFTVPHADARRVTEATQKGILFRAVEPARIEVTGAGSADARQLLADTAAEELARRGKAVDPSARVGVRIELSKAKRTQRQKSVTVEFIGTPPPSELREVYEVEARVYLINLDNGSVSKAPMVVTKVAAVGDPQWEAAIAKGIGKVVGMTNIPLAGSYDAEGKDAKLSQPAPLGIDGVLEIPAARF